MLSVEMKDGSLSADVSAFSVVKKMLTEQLRGAISPLQHGASSDTAVHAGHTNLKRARATLRLLRECIGERAYRQYKCTIRDAAGQLTPIRDAEMLVQTVVQLSDKPGKEPIEEYRNHLLAVLIRERRVIEQRRRWKPLIVSLHDLAHAVKSIPQSALTRVVMKDSLTLAYRSCRKGFLKAKRRPTDTHFHEWRKQVKFFTYQIEAVQRANQAHLTKIHRQCGKLAECLGDDHDLAVLHTRMRKLSKSSKLRSQTNSGRVLIARLKQNRAALQSRADRIGMRLYSKSPKDFRRRISKRLATSPASPRAVI
jgi:CHAD domain-containing protein